MKKSGEKIIIGVHGLGNKPSKNVLRIWWEQAILEGLKKYNYPVKDFNFELVYWADILHEIPLDPEEQNKKSPLYVSEKYIPEVLSSFSEPMTHRQKAIEYLEKYYSKILINGILSLNSPSLMNLFIHLYLQDLEKYYSLYHVEQNGGKRLAREVIIERFCEVVRKHRDKKILVVAHSMGSIIVHDALFKYIPEIKIDTLVTIGSPLAQKYVIHKILEEQKDNGIDELKTADNIERSWFNLSDLQDQVALNHKTAEFYKANKKGIVVQDMLVQNKYEYAGVRNPHKSFGYLRTPEFAEIVNRFLAKEKFSLWQWIKKKFS